MIDLVEKLRVSDAREEPRTELQDFSKTPGKPTRTAAPTSETPHWAERWTEIQDRINSRPRVLLATGFDGILRPLVERSGDHTLPEATRSLLRKLVATRRVILAFVSGRSLREIEVPVSIAGAFYVGNYGMELRGPGFYTADRLGASSRADIVDAIAFLTRTTTRLRGVYIHDKGLSVAVHGNVSDSDEVSALRELMEVIARRHPRLIATAARGIWELRPREVWNEGSAIQQLLTHFGFASGDAIYIGDDLSDEDAFRELSDALTFRVGIGTSTAARYRLGNLADTAGLLFCIFCALSGMRITSPHTVEGHPTP